MRIYSLIVLTFISGCASLNYQSPLDTYKHEQKMKNQQRDEQLKTVLELTTKNQKVYLLGGHDRGNNPCFEIDSDKSSRTIPLKFSSVEVWTPDDSIERKITFSMMDDKKTEYKIYATLSSYSDNYEELLSKCFVETKNIKSKISTSEKKSILKNKIYISANKDVVLLALGRPDTVNTSVNLYAKHEQWVYGYEYIYLKNGLVTSWQQ